jgi:hypothetical protein
VLGILAVIALIAVAIGLYFFISFILVRPTLYHIPEKRDFRRGVFSGIEKDVDNQKLISIIDERLLGNDI